MAVRRPVKVRQVSKFDAQTFLTSVGPSRRSVKYKSGDIIFRQGDPADAVFYIEKGSVQIAVVSDQGKEGVIGMLRAGDFFR